MNSNWGGQILLLCTETGVNGTSWTYLEADEIAESGLERLNSRLRLVIRAYGAERAHESFRDVIWKLSRL